MKLINVHLFNVAVLILMGGWSYKTYQEASVLLPILFGVAMLSVSNGIRYGDKEIIKVCAVVSIFALLSIVFILVPQALKTSIVFKQLRTGIMLFSSSIAVLYYWSHIITNRKKTKQKTS